MNNDDNNDDDDDNNNDDGKYTPIRVLIVVEDRGMTAGRQGWWDRHTTIILIERYKFVLLRHLIATFNPLSPPTLTTFRPHSHTSRLPWLVLGLPLVLRHLSSILSLSTSHPAVPPLVALPPHVVPLFIASAVVYHPPWLFLMSSVVTLTSNEPVKAWAELWWRRGGASILLRVGWPERRASINQVLSCGSKLTSRVWYSNKDYSEFLGPKHWSVLPKHLVLSSVGPAHLYKREIISRLHIEKLYCNRQLQENVESRQILLLKS